MKARSAGVIGSVKTFTKQGIAVGFLVLMCIKAWVMPLLYLDYELRKEFIIANFCVNKNRPELHCDGKCYLAQRLKAAQEQEEEQAGQAFLCKLLEQATDCRTHFASFIAPELHTYQPAPIGFAYTSPLVSCMDIHDVFHPPQAA